MGGKEPDQLQHMPKKHLSVQNKVPVETSKHVFYRIYQNRKYKVLFITIFSEVSRRCRILRHYHIPYQNQITKNTCNALVWVKDKHLL